MGIIDFSNMDVFPRFYGGSEKKLCVIYCGNKYMLKFPKRPNERDRTSMEISYSNNVFSEYISCRIVASLGLPVQNVLLGYYKNKTVVACQDFVKPGEQLVEFDKIKVSYLSGSSNGQGTELSDVLSTIKTHPFIPNKEKVLERFWDMFIADTLLANFDRHNGNWGFLVNEEKKTIRLAPVYDCGSCLLPRLSDDQMRQYLNDFAEIEKRVYIFPNAALKVNNDKLNFYKFLTETDNTDCLRSIERMFPKIDLQRIGAIIDNTPIISDIRKEFYKTYISERYKKIIVPAYEHMQKTKQQIHKKPNR